MKVQRAFVVTLMLALAWLHTFVLRGKFLSYVMGKVLSGELSYMRTGLVTTAYDLKSLPVCFPGQNSPFKMESTLKGKNLLQQSKFFQFRVDYHLEGRQK